MRERESSFSLEIRAIRPSAVFGTRRRTALCGEGFAWVLDLGSFLKLREVGVSPYLGFIPSLSTLRMFELNEAVRGYLIGPKTWDRIDIIFKTKMEQPVTAPRLFWVDLIVLSMRNHVLIGMRPKMAGKCGFTR